MNRWHRWPIVVQAVALPMIALAFGASCALAFLIVEGRRIAARCRI